MNERGELRQRLRQRRNSLSPSQRRSAADSLRDRLCATPFFAAARRIAAYLPNDGEIDTRPIVELAWQDQREVFLPIVQPGRRLAFAPYTRDTRLAENRFGIAEPVGDSDSHIAAQRLDLVLMPLVAFDPYGSRIGMGGGYYDRSFEFLRDCIRPHRPRLVGIGYDFQRVDKIDAQPWDVPAWRVVTERAIYPISE